jgi:LDH2 family malate/lactate/ureidoglycolate dehydrogenase
MSTSRSEPAEAVLLTVEAAHELAQRSLRKLGYGAADATIIGDHIVDNALCGYRFIAFPRILQIADHVRKNPLRGPIKTTRITPNSARIDGGNEIGYLVYEAATRLAVAIAGENRFAFVGVHNSVTSGRVGYYLEMVSKAGLVGLQFTGAAGTGVAPFGGRAAALGTNPIAFSFPARPEAIVFDIGTSATMGGDVMLAKRLGELLPEGVAIDRDGKPTQDPGAVGAILPFGGYKGYGLAFIAQVFAILAGAPLNDDRVRGPGAFFIAFQPELLMPVAEFEHYLSRLTSEIKATPRREGVDEIRIPSERAFRERARRRVAGVEIDRPIYDALLEL